MFWDKGYAPSQNIELLLQKENATVEEFLDEEDILQECKSQKIGIMIYFARPENLRRLVELITTEPSEDLPLAQRFKYANMACEVLTLGLQCLDEKIISDPEILKMFYSYLEKEPPLNPLLSSFFCKTFSLLFQKKNDQDWFLYQQMCLKLLEYIKSQNNFLDLICKHFSTPVIPDLIMQMMHNVEGGQLKRNLFEWLTENRLVERLFEIIDNPDETDKHANVAEFLCDLIQQGRSMRQNENENDSFEPAFTGSNPILKTIESKATIKALLNVILKPNAQESAIVSGISVVLTLIKPFVFVDEANSDRAKYTHNREREIHEQILATVISVITPHLKNFNELLKNPPNTPEIITTAATLSPPFGQTRLYVCRLFTVLLQSKKDEISKAICEIDFFETIFSLFKQYCWNNFLHSEVEKCLHLVFENQLSNNSNNSTQDSTIMNDGSFTQNSNNGDNTSLSFDNIFKTMENAKNKEISTADILKDIEMEKKLPEAAVDDSTNEKMAVDEVENESNPKKKVDDNVEDQKTTDSVVAETMENLDIVKPAVDSSPSALQTHVIVNCKLISKLIDCWQHNKNLETAEKGRRLGYMGHLIKIIQHITNCISESEHIGALIESSLSDATEQEMWQSIINPNDGDFTKALATQNRKLANCNAHDSGNYGQHLPKDFLNDNNTWDYAINTNVLQSFGENIDSIMNTFLDHDLFRSNMLDNEANAENDLNLFQFGRGIDDDDDEDEDEDVVTGVFTKSSAASASAFGVTNNPWDNIDPFSDEKTQNKTPPWVPDFGADNFADFDKHFDAFTNDLGQSLSESITSKSKDANNGAPNITTMVQNEDDNVENKADIEQLQQQKQQKEEKKVEEEKKLNVDTSQKVQEFDDNANLESAIIQKRNFANFEVASLQQQQQQQQQDDEEEEGTLIKKVLDKMMLDTDDDDDYEDDEGMWTKPLGGGNPIESEETGVENQAPQLKDETTELETVIPNGPSRLLVATNKMENEIVNETSLDIDAKDIKINDLPKNNDEAVIQANDAGDDNETISETTATATETNKCHATQADAINTAANLDKLLPAANTITIPPSTT